jgi:hypothetical protein
MELLSKQPVTGMIDWVGEGLFALPESEGSGRLVERGQLDRSGEFDLTAGCGNKA